MDSLTIRALSSAAIACAAGGLTRHSTLQAAADNEKQRLAIFANVVCPDDDVLGTGSVLLAVYVVWLVAEGVAYTIGIPIPVVEASQHWRRCDPNTRGDDEEPETMLSSYGVPATSAHLNNSYAAEKAVSHENSLAQLATDGVRA